MYATIIGIVCAVAAVAAGQTTQPALPDRVEIEDPRGERSSAGPFGLSPAVLDEPLVTDRPDFTESTDAVPFCHAQLEGGYTFTYDHRNTDRTHDHTAPELLLRLGVFDRFELRIDWAGYSWTQSLFEGETRGGRTVTREDWDEGANDVGLGFKYKFFDQAGLRPHFGVIGQVSAPAGSAGVSSGDVDPEVKLLWAYVLTDRLAVSGNVNLAVPTQDAHRFLQTAASVSVAAALTQHIGSYVEYFGFYPNERHGKCAHSLNGGLTFLITNDFQIDVRAGLGLNEEADDFFSGGGFAWRF